MMGFVKLLAARGGVGHPPVTKEERLIPARDEATGVQSIVRATG